jgi:hypothetical protein
MGNDSPRSSSESPRIHQSNSPRTTSSYCERHKHNFFLYCNYCSEEEENYKKELETNPWEAAKKNHNDRQIEHNLLKKQAKIN